jgi:uncharacterized iron-regulated protein
MHKTRVFALSLLTTAAVLGTALAAATVTPLPDLTSYALVKLDARGAAPVSADAAANVLKDYDVVVLGELHDHTGNHVAEMALFRALYAKNPKLALSMEMFERDVQPVLDEYLSGKIGEEVMKRRGRAWGNYAESYRPLVEYAKERKLAVIAANAPAAVVRCVGQDGPDFLARIPADKRSWAAAELHLNEGPYKAKFMRFLEEDGAHGPEDANKSEAEKQAEADRSFASQVTRDDTMAESIVNYLRAHPGEKIVHVTGDFHAEAFLGTVERIKLRAPDLKIAVVTPIQVSDPERPSVDAKDLGNGTFAVLLRAEPEMYANMTERDAEMERLRAMFRGRATRTGPCAL